MMDTENQNTVLGYDPVGNLTSRADSNAVTNTYTYDTLNRLTNLTVGSLNSYIYTLGPTGNRTKVVEAEGRTGIFVQDDLYRLQQDNYTQDPNVPDAGVTYSYDPVGNRLQKNSNSFNFDTNDRITMTGYSFDNNGNMLTDPVTGNNYQYDINNRLISVTKQNGDNITYTYDFDGNRISKTLNSGGNTTTTVYVVDGNNLTGYSQVFEEMQGGQVTVRYSYGTQMLEPEPIRSDEYQELFRTRRPRVGAHCDGWNGHTYRHYGLHGLWRECLQDRAKPNKYSIRCRVPRPRH